VADDLCVLHEDGGVPHLPNRQGPSLEEPLHSVALVLKVQFGSSALRRLFSENSLFNSAVSQLLLKLSKQKALGHIVRNLVSGEGDSVAGIGKTTESSEVEVVRRSELVLPDGDVVGNDVEDGGPHLGVVSLHN
jgi:hypothetical protein